MVEASHDLELTVLEALILQNSLDGHEFVGLHQSGLVDDSKGPISDNLCVCVGNLLRSIKRDEGLSQLI